MKLFLTILPFYTVIMLLVLLVPVRINIFYLRENKDDFISIRINTFFSLLRLNLEVPLLQQEAPLELSWEAELKAGQDKLLREEKDKLSALTLDWSKIFRFLRWVQRNRHFLKYLSNYYLQAMTVERLNLTFQAGLTDAAATGMLTGFFWNAAGILSVFMQKRFRLKKKPVLIMQPDFNGQAQFKLYFDSVVSFRIGHFMLGGILFLSNIIRGGTFKCRNIQYKD
ncbi:MAG: DUF2953 domain-containing protein [Firmicutes bacterium]|nr:DUF2953 domain-containing protein [Bacillota bacterium]